MGVFRRRARAAADDEGTGISSKDLAVLEQLRQHGADLAEPRHVIHFLYAPSESAARELSAAAAARGFHGQVREPLPDDPGRWTVVCETEAVLSRDFVRASTDFFENLALRHGGTYDGWEAAV